MFYVSRKSDLNLENSLLDWIRQTRRTITRNILQNTNINEQTNANNNSQYIDIVWGWYCTKHCVLLIIYTYMIQHICYLRTMHINDGIRHEWMTVYPYSHNVNVHYREWATWKCNAYNEIYSGNSLNVSICLTTA